MKLDAVGFGALNYDRLFEVERFPVPGAHMPILSLSEAPGGSAANTVAVLAGLGAKTGFLGAVGGDLEADVLLSDFRRRRVDASRIQEVKGRTGQVVIFFDEDGERTIYPYPSANSRFRLGKDDVGYASGAQFVHLSAFVGEKQRIMQNRLVEKLPTQTSVSFAPGSLYSRMGAAAHSGLLSRTKILFVNEAELKALSGAAGRRGCLKLNKLGVEVVAVTLGGGGCFVYTNKECFSVPALKAKVVDTTGAGDAFAAGFLWGLLENKPLNVCGKLGNRQAAKCIGKIGARTSFN